MKLIAYPAPLSSWKYHVVPLASAVLILAGIVYLVVDPERVLRPIRRYPMIAIPLAVAWLIELRLATSVGVRDDASLEFRGLFRHWVVAPAAISRIHALPIVGLAVVRHADGFLLLPSDLKGGAALQSWVREERRKRGLD